MPEEARCRTPGVARQVATRLSLRVDDASGSSFLRLEGGLDRLRHRCLRRWRGPLRSIRDLASAARDAWLECFSHLGGDHRNIFFSVLASSSICPSSIAPSPLRPLRDLARCRARSVSHLVHRASALAALGRAVDGCGLGHGEQRRHQCHGRSLVRSRPPKGAQSHPQWSKPRRGLVPTRLCRPHRRCRLRRLWNAGRRRSPERLAPAHGRQVCDLDPFDLPPPSPARVQHT